MKLDDLRDRPIEGLEEVIQRFRNSMDHAQHEDSIYVMFELLIETYETIRLQHQEVLDGLCCLEDIKSVLGIED